MADGLDGGERGLVCGFRLVGGGGGAIGTLEWNEVRETMEMLTFEVLCCSR